MTTPQLTYTGVAVAVFANQVGLPFPSVVVLMAAGALSANGHMRTSIIVLLAVLGCLAGDAIWFWLGRKWGSEAIRLLCRFTADPRACSSKAHEKFRRYGLSILCMSKFLPGLDAVMPPLAGSEGVSAGSFFTLDGIGSFLWSSCYVGLGYAFSSQLEVAISWAEHFGKTVGIAIGLPILLYVAWRALALMQMVLRLRLRRISPPLLARKLKSKSKVAVLDLSHFEEEKDSGTIETIPGAFVVDPALLRKSPRIVVPDEVRLILYSSNGSATVCARAAIGLKRVGIHNVWVLDGGLEAWRGHGFPVSRSPEKPEVVAGRLGVTLPAASPADSEKSTGEQDSRLGDALSDCQ